MSCCAPEPDEASSLVRKPQPRQQMIREEPEDDDIDPNGTYQCRNCRRFYKQPDNGTTACNYHTGRYIKRNTAAFSSTEWSCCKSLYSTAKGCKVGRHRPIK